MSSHTLYAIGDIHGYLDRLDMLLARVEKDANGTPYQLLFVGDYIDRGPESKRVIDRMIELQKQDWQYPPVFLKGNHEEAMIDLITQPFEWEYFRLWAHRYGGDSTLVSYGLEPLINEEHGLKLSNDFRAAVSPEQREFLEGLKLSFQTATHFFCHAGIDIEMPLHRQIPYFLLNVRQPFLDNKALYEKIVVHGHSITKSNMPEVHPNRIAIDTGVYVSGNLTALVLRGREEPRFVITGPW